MQLLSWNRISISISIKMNWMDLIDHGLDKERLELGGTENWVIKLQYCVIFLHEIKDQIDETLSYVTIHVFYKKAYYKKYLGITRMLFIIKMLNNTSKFYIPTFMISIGILNKSALNVLILKILLKEKCSLIFYNLRLSVPPRFRISV